MSYSKLFQTQILQVDLIIDFLILFMFPLSNIIMTYNIFILCAIKNPMILIDRNSSTCGPLDLVTLGIVRSVRQSL